MHHSGHFRVSSTKKFGTFTGTVKAKNYKSAVAQIEWIAGRLDRSAVRLVNPIVLDKSYGVTNLVRT